MAEIGVRARRAMHELALAPEAKKNAALAAMAKAVRAASRAILAANAEDLTEAAKGGATVAYLDRLKLDDKRIASIADGIDAVRALKDPVGAILESWTRPNGMTIERVRVPLGVIGVIY